MSIPTNCKKKAAPEGGVMRTHYRFLTTAAIQQSCGTENSESDCRWFRNQREALQTDQQGSGRRGLIRDVSTQSDRDRVDCACANVVPGFTPQTCTTLGSIKACAGPCTHDDLNLRTCRPTVNSHGG